MDRKCSDGFIHHRSRIFSLMMDINCSAWSTAYFDNASSGFALALTSALKARRGGPNF
jgi:hypothetical protein